MLTQKAKYAIKALVCLAQNEGLVRTKDIAENARIPKKFLESILLELKSHQLVASVQGAGGGYHLLKKPEEITLAAVYRIFEGPIALVPCASMNFYQPCLDCEDEKSCQIRSAMIIVREQTLYALQQITIEKMTAGKE
jgi:Rrf2 family protein